MNRPILHNLRHHRHRSRPLTTLSTPTCSLPSRSSAKNSSRQIYFVWLEFSTARWTMATRRTRRPYSIVLVTHDSFPSRRISHPQATPNSSRTKFVLPHRLLSLVISSLLLQCNETNEDVSVMSFDFNRIRLFSDVSSGFGDDSSLFIE